MSFVTVDSIAVVKCHLIEVSELCATAFHQQHYIDIRCHCFKSFESVRSALPLVVWMPVGL